VTIAVEGTQQAVRAAMELAVSLGGEPPVVPD